MNVERLVTNIGQLVTAPGAGALRGRAMYDLHVTRDAAVAISDGRIAWCGTRRAWHGSANAEIDAGGMCVMPGLVDPHTHLVWGGDRLADFEARASGVTYEALLASGGGIRHTVRCTNESSDDSLVTAAVDRVDRMLRAGSTTIEVKSGYGGDLAGERRQLEIIRRLASAVQARIAPTMLCHLPPTEARERIAFIREATTNSIPDVARASLATAVDVFVEREAFTVSEAEALLRAASASGLAVKVHADQFAPLGGTELAVALGALSVDHLEASGPAQVAALAASDTVAVLLPGVSLHLGIAPAPGRALIDAGAIVAIGTDCNPGSAPLFSMALAMALAVRLNGLTPVEAFVAATANAAAALGLPDVGRIVPGARADLLLLRCEDWRQLPYVLGDDLVARVFVGGQEIPQRAPRTGAIIG